MTHERIKAPSRRYFGILLPIEVFVFLGLMPLIPRQYLFRRVEENGAVALEVLNRWFFQDTRHCYDFQDIQAITVRRTRAGLWISILMAFFSMIFVSLLALAIRFELPEITQILLTVFTAFAVLFLLLNLVRGATCVCEIHTRVNKERLYGLSRWGQARPAVEALISEIETVQGPAEIPPGTDAVACAKASLSLVQIEHIRRLPMPTTGWHRVFFALLLLMAISSAVDLRIYSEWKNLGDMCLFSLLLLTGSLAVMRQRYDGAVREAVFHPMAKRCALGGMAALLGLYYLCQMLAMTELMSSAGALDVMDGGVLRPGPVSIFTASVVNIALLTPLGVLGLWGLAKSPRNKMYD